MSFTLSVLDQSPIVHGASPADAIAATIALARRAEELGYYRYWLAEHHAMTGFADAAPEVLLARLTAATVRIRLGTGGIMLPHYSAFKVAESFRMLEALAPGRIDLGIGRAPGGTGLVSAALESRDVSTFPEQLLETIGYLDRTTPADSPFAPLTAMPSGTTSPAVWLLGSSAYGAALASDVGLPYAYAHFIGGDAPQLTAAYRRRFRPSVRNTQQRVAIALAALVAPTDAEAATLALPLALWRMRLLRGSAGPIPTLEEAQSYAWTPLEQHEIARTQRMIAGSPETVRRRIETIVEEHAADEVIVVTIAPDYASRLRSYELLASAFELEGSSVRLAGTAA
ncbi:MAG: LLM class flavin-dependent oxidoreductase [Vulcanimicrobiaceae bacterium]